MSRTIVILYFSVVNCILHKEIAYIHIPRISCAGIPHIIFHPYGAMIILENNILLNIVSLCFQKHNHPYIERNILTSSYNFSLSWNFCIQILISGLEMKHYWTYWHYSSCMAEYVWMYIIWRINPCEQVCKIKTPNGPNIVHCLIQVWYASSKFLPILHISLNNPCGKEFHSRFYIWRVAYPTKSDGQT